MMRIYLLILCGMFFASPVYAEQICKPDSIPASTPDSQLVDNVDGTITDLRTRLMWKKCLEGVSGNLCDTGSPGSFTWQQALQQPGVINNAGGFAGHTDWRLPNIRELISIVEEQCKAPAINLDRFPNTPSSSVWSGSPNVGSSDGAWYVYFDYGGSVYDGRDGSSAVRLVRGGQ
ncbi:MAG: DUF1566 domain-containing protein [Candidatus Electrothrix sp. AS4_5]|nr:DUF1566 domain-containing protein [Candidatus Electrothrix gigas]